MYQEWINCQLNRQQFNQTMNKIVTCESIHDVNKIHWQQAHASLQWHRVIYMRLPLDVAVRCASVALPFSGEILKRAPRFAFSCCLIVVNQLNQALEMGKNSV